MHRHQGMSMASPQLDNGWGSVYGLADLLGANEERVL